MTRSTGRHSAPAARKTYGAAAFATSAAVGMTASVAFAAPEEAQDATAPVVAESLTISTVNTGPDTIALDLPSDTDWEFEGLEITSEEPPAPEPEPVVENIANDTQEATRNAQQGTRQAEQAQNTVAQSNEQQAQPQQEEVQAQAAPAPANSSVVAIARQYAGSRYVHGGSSPAGFDCSGFTSFVYAQVGIYLPRTSSGQRSAGYVVPASQAQPGDLMWWPGHVGIYTGGGMHIAARTPASGVKEGPVYGNPTYIRVR